MLLGVPFPGERNRLIRLLVEKLEVRETGIDMELKTNGLTKLINMYELIKSGDIEAIRLGEKAIRDFERVAGGIH
jgi:phage head maturation protease